MLITKRERLTLLYIVPLIILLAALLFIFWRTKPGILPTRNIGCVICHPAREAKYPHVPYVNLKCLSCHTQHKFDWKGLRSGPSELRNDITKLCNTCHNFSKYFQDDIVHKPVKLGRCVSCHNPHGSNYPYMFKSKTGEVCRSCHFLTEFTAKRVKHKPYEKGWCISCHTGHSSNVPFRLRKPQKELCLGCHQTIAQDVNKPYQMKPFREGRCTDCHHPHATDNNKVLRKPIVQLCATCHPTQWNEFIQGKSRHPVPEGKINCLNCHVPHGAWFAKQLQGRFDKSATSCGACHVPHGSSGDKLLATGDAVQAELCTTCHKPSSYNSPFSHPVKNRFDPSAEETLKCTSTCHQGLFWPNMNIFEGIICLNCHTGHNSPNAAIDSATAEKTKLLKKTIKEIQQTRWQDKLKQGEADEPINVSIGVPAGKSRVIKEHLTSKAYEVIGNYHRMAQEQQFKIRSDGGCMLCHSIYKLP